MVKIWQKVSIFEVIYQTFDLKKLSKAVILKNTAPTLPEQLTNNLEKVETTTIFVPTKIIENDHI